jgi:hypothetical protein
MPEHTPKDIERMEEKAKREDKNAERARDVVQDALSKMTPQRQHHTENSQQNQE